VGKALTSLVIFAAGAAAGIATTYAYESTTNGDDGSRATVRSLSGQQTYTLRDGDVAVRAEAQTRCLASSEGGQPNLFCTRIPRGRHQVIFYKDSVLVWPLARGPDGPPFTYRWTP
jgi:hypothetical protein